MADDADVLVVGAGPAGAASALLLAQAGHDVLVIDRHEFPRAKPCGDCLSAATTPLLAALGVLPRVQALPHARLAGWRIFAPDGGSFSAAFENASHGRADAALAVERSVLDAALLDAACAAGARFAGQMHVRQLLRNDSGAVGGVQTDAGPLRARLTVGADGLRSVVARRLGVVTRPARLRKLSLTMHIDTMPRDLELGEMHTGPGLCAGVAPLRSDAERANLTVVADAARYRFEASADPRAFMRRVLAAMPGLRGRIDDAALDQPEILASGPFDVPVRRAAVDGAALVGDAAGYYDPFTGQGVHHALLGAQLLARTAHAALQAGDCSAARLAPYVRELDRSRRGPRFVQRAIEQVLARPRLASFAIRRINAAPAFAAALVAVTGDLEPVTSLFSPHVLAPLFRPAAGEWS